MVVDVPQLPAPPSLGRPGRGRPRGRSTPPPVTYPALELGTGPAPGQHLENYIFRRWWDVAVELEELMNLYDLIRKFENTPYTKKAAAKRLWETFNSHLEICRSAWREIIRLGGDPPSLPENLLEIFFGYQFSRVVGLRIGLCIQILFCCCPKLTVLLSHSC